MPGKPKTPAPIDRPIAKAYLREFTGWSTNYPPGLSAPTSLRVADNVMIGRDGSARTRPAMIALSYTTDLTTSTLFKPPQWIVGSHEVFFLNSGRRAYLFAVKELDGTVGFRVMDYDSSIGRTVVRTLTDPAVGFSIPQGDAALHFNANCTYVKYLQIDNKIFALGNSGEPVRVFWVGTTKVAKKMSPIIYPAWLPSHKLTVVQPDQSEFPTPTAPVTAETPTAGTAGDKTSGTLISSTAADNVYNYGYFYTFSNELGESAASQVTVIKAKRRWSSWMWETPNANGEPSGTGTGDPDAAADQLVAYMPQAVFDANIAAGATSWNLYMLTWSDQDAVPPEATLLASRDLTSSPAWSTHGWIRHSPANGDYNFSAPLPTVNNRYNYSDPTKAGQGLVAADRMIAVYDPTNPAVIRWSSNQQGNYTDFSSSKGGGYKTLTSGNLFIPACVKLWQNPQSVDTLTVLCLGTDGYSTSYYMAPAEVTGQSDATPVMGFEETTATPGTSSPYGVEVFNNSLYHPLDDQLMKSTASNYNINHKSLTEDIKNMWVGLSFKETIVSAQMDGRIYYLVQNPQGESLESGCRGNEIWVLDAAADTPVWMRWRIQACSLRKIGFGGQVFMSVIRPDGIYYLDENYSFDHFPNPGSFGVNAAYNYFQLETNTQGANRAHDAWCHLEQVNITLGRFRGALRWGIRGWDINGRAVEVAKVTQRLEDYGDRFSDQADDYEDYLKVGRQLREWKFFAESVEDTDGARFGRWKEFYGQISFVQYRYTPISVNVGYEYGSVETFEYTRALNNPTESTTTNGVPVPVIDVRPPPSY